MKLASCTAYDQPGDSDILQCQVTGSSDIAELEICSKVGIPPKPEGAGYEAIENWMKNVRFPDGECVGIYCYTS